MRFRCTAPGEAGGIWELDTFTQSRAGTAFHINYEDCPGSIPMDVEAMRSLLSESEVLNA